MAKFESELIGLGLKDKEAAIYLACLQLGSSPVQQIARKAKVVRATAYVILESLMHMGLVTKYQEGKKTLFSAEAPRQLMRLLERQREEIEDKQQDLEQLLPELMALVKEKGVPTVRYFEGREGLHAIRQEVNMYSRPGEDTIYNFTPADYLGAVFPDSEDSAYKQRLARGIKAKTIFTTKSTSLKKKWLLEGKGGLSERRFVDSDKFPFRGGVTIYRDRIVIVALTGKLFGVVIESQGLADTLQYLFELAWIGAAEVGE